MNDVLEKEKKLVSFFLAFVLVLSMFGVNQVNAEQANLTSGKVEFATLATDGSLNFYYRDSSVPSAGTQFDGKIVLDVFTDFNGENVYGSASGKRTPWYSHRDSITTLNVVDKGVPMPSGAVFYGLNKIKRVDLTNFDTSTCTDVTRLFAGCSSLEEVNISNLNTSSIEKPTTSSNGSFFQSCSALAKITVGEKWTLGMGKSTSGGVGNLPTITEGIYTGTNDTFRGKYLTGRWTDGTGEYEDINEVTLGVAGTYTWQVNESESQCVVTFDANGGYFQKSTLSTSTTEYAYCEKDGSVEAPAYPIFNIGYDFKGWFDDKGEQFDPESKISKSQTYYAKWEETALPEEWQATDFTYNSDGTEVTGLTETGKLRIKKGQRLDLTKADSGKGVVLSGIADALTADTFGLFAFAEGAQIYSPSGVDFPNTITKIGAKSFYYFGGSSIELPSELKTIGERAFQNSCLVTLEIPSGVESMGAFAFADSNNLCNLSFIAGEDKISALSSISTYAFKGCPLTSLKLSEGLTTIESGAFGGAYSTLEETQLPTTVTTLSVSAFSATEQDVKTNLFIEDQTQLKNNPGIIEEGNAHKVRYECTVSFETNGGSEVNDQVILNGEKATKPTPTKQGYALLGWYVDPLLIKEFDFETPITQDMKLYASWTPEYTITYVLNGGSEEGNPSTYTSETESFTLKNPTKEGYTFTGWTGSNGVVPEAKVTIEKGSKGNKTYVAIFTKVVVTKVTMHRLYNSFTGEHLYTANDDEKRDLVDLGWDDEGVGWTAPSLSSVPVYRLYNPYVDGGDHHYTINFDEYKSLKEKGWSQEGIAWYSDENEGVPLYRQYNPNAVTGTHNYTSSVDEKTNVIVAGWKDEGIGWYGLK